MYFYIYFLQNSQNQIHFTLFKYWFTLSFENTTLWGSTTPYTLCYKHRLLLNDINFWHRCQGVSTYSRDNSAGQGFRWITLLVISFHSFFILFFFYLFIYFVALTCFVLLCMSVWVRNNKGNLETFETLFGSLFDTPTSSPTSSIMAEERGAQPEAPRMTMY